MEHPFVCITSVPRGIYIRIIITLHYLINKKLVASIKKTLVSQRMKFSDLKLDPKTNLILPSGDDWRVVCTGKSKDWMREESVRLVHVETKKYLSTSPRFTFAAPISGQLEVSCGGKDGSITLWAAQVRMFNNAENSSDKH